jgi:hypothetical protein
MPGSVNQSQGANVMKTYPDRRLAKSLRRAVIAILATAVAAQAAEAHAASHIVIVQPTDLPELARHPGEAMFLHDTIEGKTLLYIEQQGGSRLAILDVTDPAHVKSERSVQLDAGGAFDFVSQLGAQKELIRFRRNQNDAVLDLRKSDAPTLEMVQGQTVEGQTMTLGTGGFTVTSEPDANAATSQPAPRDYQVVDTADSNEATVVSTIKQVREEITNDDTGTTYLLGDDGLHLIRRPNAEMMKSFRQMASYG